MPLTTQTVITFDSMTVMMNSAIFHQVLGNSTWESTEISKYTGEGWELEHDLSVSHANWTLRVTDPNLATMLLLKLES